MEIAVCEDNAKDRDCQAQSYSVCASDYLVKPVSYKDMERLEDHRFEVVSKRR